MADQILLEVAKAGSLPVETGVFFPADQASLQMIRRRGYSVGTIVRADPKKARSPGFHRLAHQIGALVAENVETFEGMGSHAAFKRLQLEAGLECDELAVLDRPEGWSPWTLGPTTKIVRIPRSIAFSSMGEERFRALVRGICEHISETYWPETAPEVVEQMAEEAERYR